jgi:transaldolase
MQFQKIKIFYDGLQISRHSENPLVNGFTTNCSFFSTHSLRNYSAFFQENKDLIKNRPISFQIWEDNTDAAIQQIDAIHSIDPSIYVKIPVINTENTYNTQLFHHAIQNRIPVNVTAVYTYDQLDYIYKLFADYNVPTLVSVFGGPISDIGLDPFPYVSYAVQLFRQNKHIEILYAGVREPYAIVQAERMGAHIATVPDGVIEKLSCTKSLDELSLERVRKFATDAKKGNISLR